jgi:flagellar biosynthesis anti-sigma factor FlgM
MKIEVNNPVVALQPASGNGKTVSSNTSAEAVGSTEDRTTFHTDTQSVQTLTSQAMQLPEVRQDKVEELSQAVSSGQYQTDASSIADGILSSQDL